MDFGIALPTAADSWRVVREAEELTAHVVFDGSHTLGELFTSSTTVVDGTLASYYGISGVSGASFVTASSSSRWTKPALTSNSPSVPSLTPSPSAPPSPPSRPKPPTATRPLIMN